MSVLKKVRNCLGYTSGAVLVGGVAAYYYDQGFRRFIDFQRLVMPIALRYSYQDWMTRSWPQDRRDAIFIPMHDKYAGPILDIVLRQKGFYVKVAQFVSSMPGPCPEQIAAKLEVLQEDAPSRGFAVVKKIIETDFGKSLSEVFSEFDEEPLHAASIGQVHMAKLIDGTPVAVKVQYPEAEHTFKIDMQLFIAASQLLRPDAVLLLKQLQKNFENEFDYRREAKLQRKARTLVQESGRSNITVPEPFDQQHPVCKKFFPDGLCTKNVFVMEKLDGESIQKFGMRQLEQMAEAKGITTKELRLRFENMSDEERKNIIPSRTMLDFYRSLISLSDYATNSLLFTYNNTIGLLTGKVNYVTSEVPHDIYGIKDQLWDITGYLLFERGFCNGDPHPGNIMLLKDGRIALIDWGQVREYDQDEIRAMASLIVAVANRDEVQAPQFAHALGYKTKMNDDWVANKWANFVFGIWDDYTVGDCGGVVLVEEVLNIIDPLEDLIGDKLIAGRCLLMMRMTVKTMGLEENSSKGVESAAWRSLGSNPPEIIPNRKGKPAPANLAQVVNLQKVEH